jgi:murein DD-endopeptidase MepM/ murein hydrolase activator NlpD
LSRKIVGVRPERVRARIGVLVTATVIAALCGGAAAASGQTAGTTDTTSEPTTTTTTEATSTPTATGGTATTTSGGGTGTATASGGSGGSLKLTAEAARPGKAFIYGDHRIKYTYTVDGTRAKDLKVQAVRRSNWETVRVWRRKNVEPGTHKVRWNGITRDGKSAAKGKYLFRVRTMKNADLDRSRAKGDRRSVKLYPEKFPVRGRHTYGDGFGAARSGHSHQGQDVFAKCGKRIVAARGGRVQYSGYQAGGAGYYVVIDGRRDSHDYVYMHLKRRGPRKGSRVHTGERIGRVGQTGNASGCHLHFELWSKPGWYEGGHAMRAVTKHLKEWDHWS